MSNLRISRKTLILIVFLILLVTILLVLKILQRENPPVQTPIETITPTTAIASPIPTSSCSPNENTRSKLPFITQNYTVQYLPVPEKFFVMIKENPYEKYRTEAEKWLTSQKVDPNGPCVFWTSTKGVAPKTQ